jgi:hypothetical protein
MSHIPSHVRHQAYLDHMAATRRERPAPRADEDRTDDEQETREDEAPKLGSDPAAYVRAVEAWAQRKGIAVCK